MMSSCALIAVHPSQISMLPLLGNDTGVSACTFLCVCENWVIFQPKDPKLCVREGCTNTAIFVEERGPKYCSNECVVEDCRYDTHSSQYVNYLAGHSHR